MTLTKASYRSVLPPRWRSSLTVPLKAVVPRLMMNLSSSFDHRVVDGAVAARFVQALRGLLECPATMFVE